MSASVSEIPRSTTPVEIAADLRAELETCQLSQAQAAREIGVSSTAVSQLMSGNYPGNVETLTAKVSRWLQARADRRDTVGQLPTAPAWVETGAAGKVLAALRYAQMAGDISIVYGGAGVGKTATALRYAEQAPNVHVVTMTPATKSTATALEEIAETLHLQDPGSGAARLQRAIVRRLRGSAGLLVIDEAQHLGTEALDAIRGLHDATGVGLCLLGNEVVYARMTGGTRAAYLDRLFSRVGKRVRLPRVHQADVATLVHAWGISAGDVVKVCQQIGAKPGGLRGVTKTLRLAVMFAGEEPVGVEHVRAAWADLGGDQ